MTAYARPRDLAEALATRAAHPDYLVIAGGTDVMVHADRRPTPVGLLDLWRLPAIGFVRVTDKELAIGAGTTWHEIAHHPAIRARLAPLAAAAREIGALQIQARGTLGGNVGTSSPVGDSLPVLLALDAELEVASVRGHRRVPYATWCTGYRTTQLAPDELIVAAHVPVPGPTTRATWTVLDEKKDEPIFAKRNERRQYALNPAAARFFRFTFQPNPGVEHFQVAEIVRDDSRLQAKAAVKSKAKGVTQDAEKSVHRNRFLTRHRFDRACCRDAMTEAILCRSCVFFEQTVPGFDQELVRSRWRSHEKPLVFIVEALARGVHMSP